jgi:hypothetical protein
VLLEVYDSIPGGASAGLQNVSLRARTGAGADVATLGFVLAGNSPARVLIRGSGPALAAFGIATTVSDPVLTLNRPSYPSLLATNAGWANDPEVSAASQASGAFAYHAGSRDAAMVVRLDPGAYTVQLSSASGTSGESLVEVYMLSPR